MATNNHQPLDGVAQHPVVDRSTGKMTQPWYLALSRLFSQTFINGITQLTGDVHAGPGSGSQTSVIADTAVTPSTYGDATHVAQVAINSQGRVTAASNVAITATGTVTHTGALTSGTLVQGNGAADVTLNATTATVTKLTSGVPSAASAGTDYTDAAFKTISVSGQSDVVADSAADTLTLVAGTNVTITTNAGTDAITINASGGGGSGTVTTTGSPAIGNLTKFSGATSIVNGDLSGDVTTSGTLVTTIANDAVTTAKILNASVTLAKIASAAASSKLVGSGASGSGAAYAEITLGSNLSMTSTTLNAATSSVVVQVVNTHTGAVATGTTVIPFDNTIPQITEGDQYMSLAITPGNASNRLRIDVTIFATSTLANWITVGLFQDSTTDAIAAMADYQNVATAGNCTTFSHFMTAGTTSATTFTIRAGRDASAAGTVTFNGQSSGRIFGGLMESSITITELTP